MDIWIGFVRLLFGFFLFYTVTYILLWLLGLCIAFLRLSRFESNRETVDKILPDREARKVPVAVIIPAYNEEACILETVDSLLAEDYPALEIIVVDDGSTDGTFAVMAQRYGLEPWQAGKRGPLATAPVERLCRRKLEDREILLIRKENGGKADALNCGLNFCEAPYCVVLDADTQVERGSIRVLTARFLLDPRTIVCAGSIRANPARENGRQLNLLRRGLVQFQRLEYCRTFYMQRLLFEQFNANVIVSGAFAMFDSALLRRAGGYRVNTIGEDMEITMRLHAFCVSQQRDYRIAFVPEARCGTQVPFRYRDYFRQRRRWHIGMLQSFRQHLYMLGSPHYGWAGVVAGSVLMLYELLAPFVEVMGILTMAAAYALNIMNTGFAISAFAVYAVLSILNQLLLLSGLHHYGVERIGFRGQLRLAVVAVVEFFFFHPLNVIIKVDAFLTRKRYRTSWGHIRRAGAEETAGKKP